MTRSWFWFISSQSINLSLVGIRFPDLQSNSRSNSFGTTTDCTGSQLMVNPKNIQPDLVMLRLDQRIFGPVIVPDPCQYQTVTSSSISIKFGVSQLGPEFRLCSGSPFSLGFQYFQGAKGGNSGTMVNICTTTRVTCLARCDGTSSGIETHL